MSELEVEGVVVEVVRKAVRYMHLRVYPPDGRVRATVPFFVTKGRIRRAIERKLAWIKHHRERLQKTPILPRQEMVAGEQHYFLGQPYLLNIQEHAGRPGVALRDSAFLDLLVRPQSGKKELQALLDNWYRKEMKERIPPLLEKWQKIMEVEVEEWGVKKMKSRWGSCNIRARRIWLNLELAKKPVVCLEYVLVHELVHLFERLHNKRFYAHMDRFMPEWRLHRDELNRHGSMADD